MKVVAFNGSPRKGGNTEHMIRLVLENLETEGVSTELVQLGGQVVRGCSACYVCADRKDKRCAIKSDMINECIEKMMEADGIIIGSPTYFTDVTAETKALIDRAGIVSRKNDFALRRKIGAAVTAVRRAGSLHAFNTINAFFLANQVVIPGSSYWNLGMGNKPGEVEQDEEGIDNMKNLAANMAWLLKATEGSRA